MQSIGRAKGNEHSQRKGQGRSMRRFLKVQDLGQLSAN